MNNKGQALTEYLLIVVLISFIVVGLVNVFGGYLQDKMTEFSCNILGHEYKAGEKPGTAECVSEYER